MFTSMQIRLERAGQCQKCEWYYRPAKQCRQCGCLVNLKVTLANESCPVGKWGKVAPSNDFISEISQSAYNFFKPKK
jgi:hypothetical protein